MARGHVAPNLAPLTYATYESYVKNYIEPGIGAVRDPRTLKRCSRHAATPRQCARSPFIMPGHTCATLLIDLDVHPRVIMRILRHADQAVTMRSTQMPAGGHTRGAAAARGNPCTEIAAVLCGCTYGLKPLVENLNATLTRRSTVGVTGFEPATSSSRSTFGESSRSITKR